MKLFGGGALFACLWSGMSPAADINLATLTCARYQNEILGSAAPGPGVDPINTVMWLFGYSVARSRAHVMYGGALSGFGFALDAECKNNPTENLLDALSVVKPDSKNPMDLMTLECATFARRHIDLKNSDLESANTIMMWLYGFAVATAGGHVLDADGLGAFESTLLAGCAKNPDRSLFDALGAVKFAKPKS
jgi:hypothetical protein